MGDRVGSEVRDGVATLTFDNVERHNALSRSMAETGSRVLAELHGDPSVRLVVLRGAGEGSFMSGADIGQQDDDDVRATLVREANAMIAAIGLLPMPVIAIVRGYCLGAGMAVATQADLRLASEDAVFGVPAARLGLAYPFEEVARLTALIGPGAATDLLLTGRRASAAEALGWGLVQAVHPADQIETEARGLAATIADNAPLSLSSAKRAIRVASEGGRDPGARAEVERLAERCAGSSDYAEGRRAFLERRPPRFSGR